MMPLKHRNTRDIHKQNARRTVTQTYQYKKEKQDETKETHLDRSISSVPAICQNTKVISSAPGLLEKLISRVSQGKMWAETKRTLILDCKNLK